MRKIKKSETKIFISNEKSLGHELCEIQYIKNPEFSKVFKTNNISNIQKEYVMDILGLFVSNKLSRNKCVGQLKKGLLIVNDNEADSIFNTIFEKL